MRARDARALAFCGLTVAALFFLVFFFTQNPIAALGSAVAYAIFVGTRPRMLRVFARLNNTPDWSGYYTEAADFRVAKQPSRR